MCSWIKIHFHPFNYSQHHRFHTHHYTFSQVLAQVIVYYSKNDNVDEEYLDDRVVQISLCPSLPCHLLILKNSANFSRLAQCKKNIIT